MESPNSETPKRRPRYSGKYPRKFEEKYKELNPEKFPETIQKVVESGKTPAGTHRPIMLQEIMEVLDPKPGEIAVDCTLGFGGHASEILKRILPGGRLIGLDVDPIELPKTESRLRSSDIPQESVVIRQSNFAGLSKVLASLEIPGVDGVLADLGVSSMQLDNPARGFSYKSEGPLDLRMNPNKGQPASGLLASVSEEKLVRILRENADEPRSDVIARAIIGARDKTPIQTTKELARLIRSITAEHSRTDPEEDENDAVRRVFQALRIAVNDEFSALDAFLRNLPNCLKPGARVAILSFHSGEDRRVKQYFRVGEREGIYSSLSRDVIRPSSEEVRDNPRSSSAKLRWAVRA